MEPGLERRLIDERHRTEVSTKLATLETTLNLKFGELASIMKTVNEMINKVEGDVKTLNTTIYGGPRGMGLLGKVTLATSILAGAFAFITQPVKEALNHWAQKKIEEPQQMVVQTTNKRMQLFNRKTGAYEYYIQYKAPLPKPQKEGDE